MKINTKETNSSHKRFSIFIEKIAKSLEKMYFSAKMLYNGLSHIETMLLAEECSNVPAVRHILLTPSEFLPKIASSLNDLGWAWSSLFGTSLTGTGVKSQREPGNGEL